MLLSVPQHPRDDVLEATIIYYHYYLDRFVVMFKCSLSEQQQLKRLIHYSEEITKVQQMNFPYLYTDAGKVTETK